MSHDAPPFPTIGYASPCAGPPTLALRARFWSAAAASALLLALTVLLAADAAHCHQTLARMSEIWCGTCYKDTVTALGNSGRRLELELTFLPLTAGFGFAAGVLAVRARQRIRHGW